MRHTTEAYARSAVPVAVADRAWRRWRCRVSQARFDVRTRAGLASLLTNAIPGCNNAPPAADRRHSCIRTRVFFLFLLLSGTYIILLMYKLFSIFFFGVQFDFHSITTIVLIAPHFTISWRAFVPTVFVFCRCRSFSSGTRRIPRTPRACLSARLSWPCAVVRVRVPVFVRAELPVAVLDIICIHFSFVAKFRLFFFFCLFVFPVEFTPSRRCRRKPHRAARYKPPPLSPPPPPPPLNINIVDHR